MHGENLLVDDSGDRQAVEAIGKRLPKLDVVAALALVVEAVDAVDGGALVITSQNEKVLGVLDLVGKEEANGLERLLATVDVVAEEEIVGLWGEAAVLEETQQVIILPVDVAANLCIGISWSARVQVRIEQSRAKRTLMGASSSRRMG